MKLEIKGFEVFLGADLGTNKYTLHIPALKYFKTFEIKKNAIQVLEAKAREIIKTNLNELHHTNK